MPEGKVKVYKVLELPFATSYKTKSEYMCIHIILQSETYIELTFSLQKTIGLNFFELTDAFLEVFHSSLLPPWVVILPHNWTKSENLTRSWESTTWHMVRLQAPIIWLKRNKFETSTSSNRIYNNEENPSEAHPQRQLKLVSIWFKGDFLANVKNGL